MVPALDGGLVLRLLLASFLGGMIGLERELHGRPAGFRTHLLVSLGSCLYALASLEVYRQFGNFSGSVAVGVDPGRIAAQVVTGIGFLGAGAIIRDKAAIRGLTTAACLWVAAALGLACGLGLFQLALCVTLIAIASLLLLKQLESRLPRDAYFYVQIWGDNDSQLVKRVDAALSGHCVQPLAAKFDRDRVEHSFFIEYQVKLAGKAGAGELAEVLSHVAGVRRVRIE
ncbi:magnesium transporter MgtC [Geomonas silvestris]|uniref:Magnesium transporter MgtC n=1 Tax=Geomonas silvestris TaxID=2740184 RepID=A0A6V8MDS0_9BACT|nr:MgtC/SapB family protein [Geomonas silvestris]GFO57849.1 magnesium transporter MgtC [Geomonas silvestris]